MHEAVALNLDEPSLDIVHEPATSEIINRRGLAAYGRELTIVVT